MKRISFIILILTTPVFMASQLSQEKVSDLTVVIRGIKSDKGSIEVGLFDQSSAFPDKGSAINGVTLKAQKGSIYYVFKNLPHGSYAIAIHHDKNQNGKIDKNLFGIPKEGFGFSNDALGRFGPPDFNSASIKVSQDLSTTTRMRYY